MKHETDSMGRRAFLVQGGTVAAVAAAAGMAGAPAQAKEKQAKGDQAMLRVAMLSGWHAHAKGYAKTVAGMPDAKITVVWDEDAERGKGWAKGLEAPFEADLAAVFKRDDVDGVVIDAPTNMHADIMVAAAQAGKHIFTEKVMALNVAECNRIAEAVRAANVKFCISFPFLTRPACLYAKKAIEDGLLGELTFFRVRVAHDAGCRNWLPPHFWDPVQCGGGAMMDLGAHPMYVARWIGGQPKRVVSAFTYMTKHEVEDNAVSVIEFENGCLGVAETSFMSVHSPFSLEMTGTEGTLLIGGENEDSVRIMSDKLPEKKWITPEVLPEALPATIRLWMDGILKNTPIPFGLEEGTQLTELMEYAYIAGREKRQVDIPPRKA